jgi:glycosyltransferase 2 family protein
MKSTTRWWSTPAFHWTVWILVGALSSYLAMRNISWTDLRLSFLQADWRYMVLALMSVVIGTMAKVVRWRVLMGGNGKKVPFKLYVISHLAGQSLNMIYPARLGDLSRVYVIGDKGVSRVFVLGTIVLEKLWDLLSYTLVFGLLLFLMPLPAWVSESIYSMALVTLSFFTISFVVSYQRSFVFQLTERLIRWIPESLHGRLMARVYTGLTSLDVLQSRIVLIELSFWSTIIWITAVLNNHLVMLALKIHLPLTASVLILVVLQAGISLPVIPGRLGIFQYICVLALGVYGVDQTLALSYSILLHGVALMTVLLSGLICAWFLGIVVPKPKLPPMEST